MIFFETIFLSDDLILIDEFLMMFQFPSLNVPPAEIPTIHANNRNLPLHHAQPIVAGSALNDNQKGMYDFGAN